MTTTAAQTPSCTLPATIAPGAENRTGEADGTRRRWMNRAVCTALAAWACPCPGAPGLAPEALAHDPVAPGGPRSPDASQGVGASVIIVPTAPGGDHDWWVLPLADELRENGHPVEILHMPDANGTLAAELVGRSARPGLWLAGSSQCVVDTVRQPLPNRVRATSPTQGLNVNVVCAVSPWVWVTLASPLQSRTIEARLREVLARSPMAMLPGTTPSALLARMALRHLNPETLYPAEPRQRARPAALHAIREVSASSHSEAVRLVMAGTAGLALVPAASAIEAIGQGRLVALAVSGEPTGPLLKDVPRWTDAADALLALARHHHWYGLLSASPASASSTRAIEGAMRTPTFRQVRQQFEATPDGSRTIEPTAFIAVDLDRWSRLLVPGTRTSGRRRPSHLETARNSPT